MGITTFLAKSLINYQSEDSFAFKLRKKRFERLKQLIDQYYQKNKRVNIIDIGGTEIYWKIISRNYLLEKNVHITLVNLPSTNRVFENDEIFTYEIGDACNLVNYADQSFDIAHSNSVIEHVGAWDKIVKFANETKRVAKTYYVQTPNYWFPIEPHFVFPFFQWFPKSLKIKLITLSDLGGIKKANSYAEAKETIEYNSLLSKKELKKVFPEGKFYRERFAFLVKSFVVIGVNN